MRFRHRQIIGGLRGQPRLAVYVLAAAVLSTRAGAQTTAPAGDVVAPKLSIDPVAHQPAAADDVYNMSLEDLMNVQVDSVSKMVQSISQAPAAVTLIDQDQIQRSGMTSIAELLRLVPGLDVARLNASTWAVSSRGFNGPLADKLLVLVDGRTVYDPLFGGTFWDSQDYILADIEKIEVIRGSGASLWGSNAVNGVINITTKSARDTQGLRLDLLGGTLDSSASLRYGGQLDSHTFYRVYGKFDDIRDFPRDSGGRFNDGWQGSRGGFRIDRYPDADTTLTLQGDLLYNTLTNTSLPASALESPNASGGNLLGRWTHNISDDSGFSLQLYYDETRRDDTPSVNYRHDTVDVDLEDHFGFGSFQNVNWGFGTRVEYAATVPGNLSALSNQTRDDYIVNTFFQDDITCIPKRLHLIVGSKFQYSSYDRFQIQPSARLLFTPDARNTFWTGISRAVRSPSLTEKYTHTDLTNLGVPGEFVNGNPNLKPEILKSIEVGYRSQLTHELTLDVATFYNSYRQLTGVAFTPQTGFNYANGARGHSYGTEVAADYRLSDSWRLAASYTAEFAHTSAEKNINLEDSNDTAASPRDQFQFHSYYDVTRHLQVNTSAYYVGKTESASQYVRLDVGINWKLAKGLEIGITGQNLLQGQHTEFATFGRSEEIPRSAFIHLSYSF